jgi:hypothetical protein
VVIVRVVIEIAADDVNFLSKSLYQNYGTANNCAVIFLWTLHRILILNSGLSSIDMLAITITL